MSAEDNRAVIRRYFDEVWNQGRVEALDTIMAQNVLGHDATSAELKVGFESVRQVVLLFRAAFPDAQYPIYDMISEGDKVVAHWGLIGTQDGQFMGVPPTGRSVSVKGIIIFRLEHLQIIEYWGSFDRLDLMQQLGAM
jgi:steroid delta-isomerase-like uncharacterized protein